MKNSGRINLSLKKNGRIETFLQPFLSFKHTFLEANVYRKITMLVNLILPGFGNVLLGQVEIGLIVSLVFYGLIGATSNFMHAYITGSIALSILNSIIVFGILFVAILALYYYGFRKNVENVDALNNEDEISGSIIISFFKGLFSKIKNYWVDFYVNYKIGTSKDKISLITSFFIMGLPMLSYKELIKGILFFLIQVIFISYMIAAGATHLSIFFNLNNLQIRETYYIIFGVIDLIIIALFVYFYIVSLSQTLKCVKKANKERWKQALKRQFRDLVDTNLNVCALIIPVLGAIVFTIVPIVFMIFIAFTNYSFKTVEGYDNFDLNHNIFLKWVGFSTFERIFALQANLQDFLMVFAWTILWATLATFTCYFGGLLLALLLNKKEIKGKVIYRSLFVIAMAMPQFVSLLTIRTLFEDLGPINMLLQSWGVIDSAIEFWETEWIAKVLIIAINMWVGVPYYMLLMSGLLINIPKDYYEAATIEGANKWQQFKEITFPQIFFMTTPMLITSFVSNINNFNVIWFLTGGEPISSSATASTTAGSTDILITWLYKISMQSPQDYNFAGALGIIMFVISATLSLIVFRQSRSYKNEGEYQ